MTRLARKTFLAWCTGALAAQQIPQSEKDEKPKRMPDGTLQSEAILKDEQKKMLADSAKLIELSKLIHEELKKNDHHVLSVAMLKNLEEVEKLARKMRGRHTR